MPNTSFTSPKWEKKFAQAGFTDFDSWWDADGHLVEEGNFSGWNKTISWSHVSRIQLPDGTTLYLKRQQNHRPGNALKRLSGYLTFELEWENFQLLQSAHVPCVQFIHFAQRSQGGKKQCILVSEELHGMISLEELIAQFNMEGWPCRRVRYAILSGILKSVRQLHDAGILHNALKTRHLFINTPIIDGVASIPDEIKTCFIDLERAKYVGPNASKLIFKDLKILGRKAKSWPHRDLLWFFKEYLNIKKLTPDAKKTVRKLLNKGIFDTTS